MIIHGYTKCDSQWRKTHVPHWRHRRVPVGVDDKQQSTNIRERNDGENVKNEMQVVQTVYLASEKASVIVGTSV